MATKKTDWANIPDDDEEEDEYENEEEEELTEQETHQGEARETTTNEDKQEKSQLPRSEDQRIIAFINTSTHSKIYLNLYNISSNITENDIREFYNPLKIDKILPFANKVMYDLEFSNKEDALKVVEKGVGAIQNESFKLRISNKSLNPRNFEYDQRDKFDKGSDSRRYGHQDRKGGNYYDQKESRGGYGHKRGEGGRYGERRNDYRDNRKYQEEPKYVKKEDEIKLPAEWEKVWAEREKNENNTETPENQREDDNKSTPQNGKYGSDNRSKGSTYHNEDSKEEQIVKKGRGQTKYENEDTLEQDKILRKKDYHDSSNYRGDGKGGYSNRNRGGYNSHETNYSSRDYKEKQGYNKDYKREEHGNQYRGGYQGRNNDDKFRTNNQASHKPASKEVVYVQKGPEKTGGDKTAESPKQRKSLNSGTQGTNKTNIFTLLE